VNSADVMPIVLLVLLALVIGLGTGMVFLVARWRKKCIRVTPPPLAPEQELPPVHRHCFLPRPGAWLTVRSRNLQSVQSALRLHNPRPCTFLQGLANEHKLFIAPPVNGWIVITGSGLPDPSDDVDRCFRFLLDLSRKLGQVNFFSANPVLGHHAWVCVEAGRIVRAYAWAGRTLWNQGLKTRAELELGMTCLHYGDDPEPGAFCGQELSCTNTDKVPLLAARWSIDPTAIDERTLEQACGIAGEAPRLY
jgi:hypothetical protein